MANSAMYCCRVISFGLRSAGVTYKRLINKIFARMIGMNIDAYVDDMVVKSKQVGHHIKDLQEVFSIVREYKMK